MSRQALLNIIPHAFDDHSNCQEWCGFKKNPGTYAHRLLSGGKSLSGDNLKLSLQEIFHNFANNSDQLAPCGLNDFRVATAVCEKNIDFTFIKNVNEELSYSPPTKHSFKFLQQKDNLERVRGAVSKTVAAKNKHRELFKSRTKTNNSAQNREGMCYQSQSGLAIGTKFVDQPVPKDSVVINKTTAVIFFDSETTGFGKNCEIIQIAGKFNDSEYNEYILPTREIPPSATAVHSITTDDGKLFLKLIEVDTVSIKAAADGFISFLKSTKLKVILVAHNCLKFDAALIIKLIEQVELSKDFENIVYGFCDTLPIFKKKLSERKSAKSSFKRIALAEEYLKADDLIGAHNVINDVSVLQKLVNHNKINISYDYFKLNTVSVKYVKYLQSKSIVVSSLSAELRVLLKINNKNEKSDRNMNGLSANMIRKIAEAQINLKQIEDTYASNGECGIEILFRQDVGGKPRITESKAIIKSLIRKLEELKEK